MTGSNAGTNREAGMRQWVIPGLAGMSGPAVTA